MNKAIQKIINIYADPIHGLILSKILENSNISITKPQDKVYTISQEKLEELEIPYQNLHYSLDNTFLFWRNKIGIKSKKVYIIQESDISFSNISMIDRIPDTEELLKSNGIYVSFARYPLSQKVNLYNLKLESHISHNFIDHIFDNLFRCSVVNINGTMWIYLYGENKIDEIIDYYQNQYNVKTNLIREEVEEITPFEYSEFIPNTMNLAFLGYRNGFFNPYKFTDLDFVIDLYKSIKEDFTQVVPKLLEIKESINDVDLNRILRDLSKLTKSKMKII